MPHPGATRYFPHDNARHTRQSARMAQSPVYLPLVQALRGLAALGVVLYHARGHVPAFGFLFDHGHFGVAVFFALSGFVIAHSLEGANVTPGFAGRFMLRRSIRLDPAYWLSMVAVVAFGILSAAVKHEEPLIPSATDVAAHLLYVQELAGIPEINSVYWTLTYEVQFYAFLVLVLAFVPARAALALMFAIALAASFRLFDAAPHGLFLHLWPAFFAGVLARLGKSAALAVLALPMLLSADGFMIVALAAAAGLCAAFHTGWAERALSARPWQFLGAISYSLYLTHVPVTGAAAFLALQAFGAGPGAQVLTLAAIVGTSLAFATAIWLAIERPSHRLSRRVRLRRPEAERAVATT